MDAKLNHSDLSLLLAKETGMSVAKAELLSKAMFDLIIEGLEQDGIVKINGLGTFKITDVASRSSVNVNTGEKFEIKGHKKLAFIPADALKECVNQPFSMFEPVEVDDTYSDDENDVDAYSDTEEMSVEESVSEEIANEPSVAEETITENVAEDEKSNETCEVLHEPAVDSVVEETGATEKKEKRSYKWLYIALSTILFVLLSVFVYFGFIVPPGEKECEFSENIQYALSESIKTDTVVEITADTAVVETVIDTVLPLPEITEPKEYKFVITEELSSLDLKDVTLSDTLLYTMTGDWAEHKVSTNEMLTRIALKYYGDKRLWPYIVKYNSIISPNNLRKGMLLRIPKLEPKK